MICKKKTILDKIDALKALFYIYHDNDHTPNSEEKKIYTEKYKHIQTGPKLNDKLNL